MTNNLLERVCARHNLTKEYVLAMNPRVRELVYAAELAYMKAQVE